MEAFIVLVSGTEVVLNAQQRARATKSLKSLKVFCRNGIRGGANRFYITSRGCARNLSFLYQLQYCTPAWGRKSTALPVAVSFSRRGPSRAIAAAQVVSMKVPENLHSSVDPSREGTSLFGFEACFQTMFQPSSETIFSETYASFGYSTPHALEKHIIHLLQDCATHARLPVQLNPAYAGILGRSDGASKGDGRHASSGPRGRNATGLDTPQGLRHRQRGHAGGEAFV